MPIGLRLLTVLMRASPRVVSRQQLEREVWGDVLPDSRHPAQPPVCAAQGDRQAVRPTAAAHHPWHRLSPGDLRWPPRRGIGARLGRAFLLQAAFISIAALVGVLLAGLLLEGLLIRQALRDEAAHFWAQPGRPARLPRCRARATSPATWATCRRRSRRSVRVPPLAKRWRRFPRVCERAGRATTVSRLRPQWSQPAGNVLRARAARDRTAGTLPVDLARLPRIATGAVAGHRAGATRCDSSIQRRPTRRRSTADRVPRRGDDEIRELADALAWFAQRLNEFVERERNFTRDASHELRSPLTVIQILGRDPAAGRHARRVEHGAAPNVFVVRRATWKNSPASFLLLARESESGLPMERVSVNDVVATELDRARPLAEGQPARAQAAGGLPAVVEAPEKVLSVMLGNLLRNAVAYTEQGIVRVTISAQGVEIEDTGVGLPPERVRNLRSPSCAARIDTGPRRRADDRASPLGSLRLAGHDRQRTRPGHTRQRALPGGRCRSCRALTDTTAVPRARPLSPTARHRLLCLRSARSGA